jgi:hypothetical protein
VNDKNAGIAPPISGLSEGITCAVYSIIRLSTKPVFDICTTNEMAEMLTFSLNYPREIIK